MTPPLLVDAAPFSSTVAFTATAGIYTATRLPTLDEVRARRLGRRKPCICLDGSCDRCFLDDDDAHKRSLDI